MDVLFITPVSQIDDTAEHARLMVTYKVSIPLTGMYYLLTATP